MSAAAKEPELGIAIFASDEGHLQHRTQVSVKRALALLTDLGATADVVVIQRGRCDKTSAWLAEKCPWRVVGLASDSLGEARNRTCGLLQNRFLAFIDGCDMWSANFLVDALSRARRNALPAVWRPAFSVGYTDDYFRHDLLVRRETPWPEVLDPATLLIEPVFPATFLAARSILEAVPFPVEDAERGWTEVDWWWSANLAGEGIEQIPVAESIHYTRVHPADFGPERGRIGPTSLARRPSVAKKRLSSSQVQKPAAGAL